MPSLNKDKKSDQSMADINEPQKLVQNLVDKKIRNLEKRKSRLQELREMADKGQELEPEQQKAVKKLDQVVEMIDLMKDLNKSICEVLTENTKQLKKVAKKEMLDKQIENKQQELERLKTIIKFQDILSRFDTTVRLDFAKGINGAIKLSDDQLNNLDKLFGEISDTSEGKLETTTEKLMALSDGKSKEAWTGVTYHQLKELMSSIAASKYFDKETPVSTAATTTTADINTKAANVSTKTSDYNPNSKKSSAQFQAMPTNPNPNDYNQNYQPIGHQFPSSQITFMSQPSVEKDPAILAYHYGSGQQLVNNAIPDPNNTSIQQKSSHFDKQAIPTQTFTNQHFAGMPNTGVVFPTAPVATAMSGLTLQTTDMTQNMTSDINFANQQTFPMNVNTNDKHLNTSQERHQSDDNYRNNRNRGPRPDRGDPKKNVNGYGNRGRNTNKGYQSQTMGTFESNKFEGRVNGSSAYGSNTFGERNANNSNNNATATRGPRPQQNRVNRPDRADRGGDNRRTNSSNVNYNPNFAATTAK